MHLERAYCVWNILWLYNALLLTCICFPKVLTIFLVNLNTHWAYKDCQFNNCFLVKIAGSFPFDALVQPEEICKALASVVAMVISCKYFQFPCHLPHPLFYHHFILPRRGPSLCVPNKSSFMDIVFARVVHNYMYVAAVQLFDV